MKYLILILLLFTLNSCNILYYIVHKDGNGLYVNYKGSRKPVFKDKKNTYFFNDKGKRVNLGATKSAF